MMPPAAVSRAAGEMKRAARAEAGDLGHLRCDRYVAAKFPRQIEPFLDRVLYVLNGLRRSFAVAHTARQIRHRRQKAAPVLFRERRNDDGVLKVGHVVSPGQRTGRTAEYILA